MRTKCYHKSKHKVSAKSHRSLTVAVKEWHGGHEYVDPDGCNLSCWNEKPAWWSKPCCLSSASPPAGRVCVCVWVTVSWQTGQRSFRGDNVTIHRYWTCYYLPCTGTSAATFCTQDKTKMRPVSWFFTLEMVECVNCRKLLSFSLQVMNWNLSLLVC